MLHRPRISVIEDDVDVCQSLVRLLGAAGFDVSAHASAAHFLDQTNGVSSDCIVSDVRMPDVTGLELLARLKARGLETPVILITGHGDVPLAVQAMKLGARDFIEKPFDPQVLIDAVQSSLTCDGNPEDSAIEGHARADAQALITRLSRRERQVLQGIVAGHLNKQIAHDLRLSVRTVEVYRASIMTKINIHGTSNLVRIGMLAGLHKAPSSGLKTNAIPNMPDEGAFEPRPC
ncbi:response regulator [Sphingomonas sp. TREG-RG-20F-R18-01]|uniref:response regulator transcription factor n=1 Tax=Sphingomonas sp. TREG-RG-20F-R18-01 TaxID=2914982 RepID=UPI001F56DC63|nr:response regulator [Sphingomonas sp. TREG-RG-20F-R18-01]